MDKARQADLDFEVGSYDEEENIFTYSDSKLNTNQTQISQLNNTRQQSTIMRAVTTKNSNESHMARNLPHL